MATKPVTVEFLREEAQRMNQEAADKAASLVAKEPRLDEMFSGEPVLTLRGRAMLIRIQEMLEQDETLRISANLDAILCVALAWRWQKVRSPYRLTPDWVREGLDAIMSEVDEGGRNTGESVDELIESVEAILKNSGLSLPDEDEEPVGNAEGAAAPTETADAS